MSVRRPWLQCATRLGARCLTATLAASCAPKTCRSDPPAQAIAASSGAPESTRAWCPAALLAARRGGREPDRYVVPSRSDSAALAEAVARLAGAGAADRAAIDVLTHDAGYEWVDVPELPGTVLLREIETRKRGGGAYLLRLRARSRVIVQAPHTFFDEGTLPLACELFERAEARALFIDTAHRYRAAESDEEGAHPADVAHAPASLFQAATEALLGADRDATVVQLHGFATRASGRTVILSTGVAQPGQALTAQAATALAEVVGSGVARFPDDTTELGATTNVQGSATRAAGGRFLHVELEAQLRKTLLSDAGLRERFLQALARSVAHP